MRGVKKDYYQILGVPRRADQDTIHKRFLELSDELEMIRTMDPWFPLEESILELTKAYQVLSDPSLREAYDKSLDFNIVILDKDIDKTELADISFEYKKHFLKNYDELVARFDHFKNELNTSLYIIKSTSIFLIFALISSAFFTYAFYQYIKFLSPVIFRKLSSLTIVFFVSMIVIQYFIFKKFWQDKKLHRKKTNT